MNEDGAGVLQKKKYKLIILKFSKQKLTRNAGDLKKNFILSFFENLPNVGRIPVMK
jgi:hypothetical protein